MTFENVMSFLLVLSLTILISLGLEFLALGLLSIDVNPLNFSIIAWVAQISYWIACLAAAMLVWYDEWYSEY